jgi:hypothetical protein
MTKCKVAKQKPAPNLNRFKVPSKLIEAAVNDIRKLRRNRRYRISMYQWHQPNGRCAVCFAGSVMACEMKISPRAYADWQGVKHEDSGAYEMMFDADTSNKLESLDEFRSGCVVDGVESFFRFKLLDRFSNAPGRPSIQIKGKRFTTKSVWNKARRAARAASKALGYTDTDVPVDPYEESPLKFLNAMTVIAKCLKAVGL